MASMERIASHRSALHHLSRKAPFSYRRCKTTPIFVFLLSQLPSAYQSLRHIVEQIHAGIDYRNNASSISLKITPLSKEYRKLSMKGGWEISFFNRDNRSETSASTSYNTSFSVSLSLSSGTCYTRGNFNEIELAEITLDRSRRSCQTWYQTMSWE